MSSLRQFSGTRPLYALDKDGSTLTNNQTQVRYRPNGDTGFYQGDQRRRRLGAGNPEPGLYRHHRLEKLPAGAAGRGHQETVRVDLHLDHRVLGDDGDPHRGGRHGVGLRGAVGGAEGKAIYRVLLILPYAVPSFISILIFKGLFNQSFGEINMMLSHLFGIKPAWFSDPLTAKSMILIVNTWLGYPYMMILCMGLLKAIPDDLYEASAMDGANPWQNFFRITLPLLIKPLTPLMIASFAFNFNNFVLIQLLTNGGPDMIGTTTPAGYTDLLVSYTYRIAFEGGGGQDFGLAAAIATLIFLLVGALAILNLKASKMNFD